MSDRTKRFLHIGTISLAVLLAWIALFLYAYKVIQNQDYTDFDVYYRAAVRAKNHLWDQIYNFNDGASPYRYAPPWIFFFRPFAELTLSRAQIVWYFCQCIWFSIGFFFIYRSLRISSSHPKPSRREALFWTSLSYLFVLRFCLDTLTIGQVSSLMFLGYSLGLYGWMTRHSWTSALGLVIPTGLKIGPGILFGVFFSSKWREKIRAYLYAFIFALTLALFPLVLLSTSIYRNLWESWTKIVAGDSQYYDASHYGSQSLNSVLLRAVKFGWITPEFSNSFQTTFTALTCLGLFSFWLLRKPRNQIGRALFFSVGLFAPIWLMPETFKYSLTPLAIPAAFLFSSKEKSLFSKFSLFFGILTLSLAGKDLIGDTLFFGFQNYSFPFVATLLLGASTFQLAWRESYPRSLFKKPFASPSFSLPRPTAISADDWGLSPAVNRGILTLAKLGIIKRVSLMANTPYLAEGLSELKQIQGIQLGIHFNLTYGRPLRSQPNPPLFISSPGKVFWKWIFDNRSSALQEFRSELLAQLNRLHLQGVKIEHLDGHQHIHLLPGLIDGVSDILKSYGIQNVRLPYDPHLWLTSKFPILLLSLLLRPTLKQNGFVSLPFIYPSLQDFQNKRKLKLIVQKYPHCEILVHPADANDIHTLEFPDSYMEGRLIEYRALYRLKTFL